MNMIFNIILAALTLGLGLAAIGGETWNKNEQSFSSRLTCRGRISIILILAVFAVNLFKEIRTFQQEQEVERAKVRTEQRLHALLHEKLRATEQNLVHLIAQNNGHATSSDPYVIEAKKSIQQLRTEMSTLRKPVYALRPTQNGNASTPVPPRGRGSVANDDYDEISKPTMEVK
jgi:Ca2+/H+ antiporter